tara:strand:+ start:211 stop:501 length:291 start_codon:yes stop_codon:yes gene_type:complete
VLATSLNINETMPKTMTIRFHPKIPNLLLVLCIVRKEEYFVACYDVSKALDATKTSTQTLSLVAGRRLFVKSVNGTNLIASEEDQPRDNHPPLDAW